MINLKSELNIALFCNPFKAILRDHVKWISCICQAVMKILLLYLQKIKYLTGFSAQLNNRKNATNYLSKNMSVFMRIAIFCL